MSLVNESWHIWMSLVKCEWDMSRMSESCHVWTWMSHVTNESVTSHMNESCHVWHSYATFESSRHVTPLNFNGPSLTLHFWIRCLSHTCMNEACQMTMCNYSLLHLECRFFILKSQLMFWFSRSLLPRSVEKRPRRLRLKTEIEWHSKCKRLYHLRCDSANMNEIWDLRINEAGRI